MDWKNEEVRKRQRLDKRIIGEIVISDAFSNNIAVFGNGTFSVNFNSNKPCVRLCLGAEPNIAILKVGLIKMAEMLKDGPSAAFG